MSDRTVKRTVETILHLLKPIASEMGIRLTERDDTFLSLRRQLANVEAVAFRSHLELKEEKIPENRKAFLERQIAWANQNAAELERRIISGR